MSHRMVIVYGAPEDPAAFRRYYEDHHVPLARAMAGLTRWDLVWLDRGGDGDGRYALVAELTAESAEAMDRVLATPEGRAARDDLERFVTGTVDFLRGDVEEVAL
ncbi:EthD family reductase [Pseudokineococcus basanitobsidens]|uniref:EthD family reductase n=1 Tax=Pseudokineococcus basanitobsidens TaxID=1926649 RepID=A0ABU8RFX1_9ACTN